MVSIRYQLEQREVEARKQRIVAARRAASELSTQRSRRYAALKEHQAADVQQHMHALWRAEADSACGVINGMLVQSSGKQGAGMSAAATYAEGLAADAECEARAWEAETLLGAARHGLARAAITVERTEAARLSIEAISRREHVKTMEKARSARVVAAAAHRADAMDTLRHEDPPGGQRGGLSVESLVACAGSGRRPRPSHTITISPTVSHSRNDVCARKGSDSPPPEPSLAPIPQQTPAIAAAQTFNEQMALEQAAQAEARAKTEIRAEETRLKAREEAKLQAQAREREKAEKAALTAALKSEVSVPPPHSSGGNGGGKVAPRLTNAAQQRARAEQAEKDFADIFVSGPTVLLSVDLAAGSAAPAMKAASEESVPEELLRPARGVDLLPTFCPPPTRNGDNDLSRAQGGWPLPTRAFTVETIAPRPLPSHTVEMPLIARAETMIESEPVVAAAATDGTPGSTSTLVLPVAISSGNPIEPSTPEVATTPIPAASPPECMEGVQRVQTEPVPATPLRSSRKQDEVTPGDPAVSSFLSSASPQTPSTHESSPSTSAPTSVSSASSPVSSSARWRRKEGARAASSTVDTREPMESEMDTSYSSSSISSPVHPTMTAEQLKIALMRLRNRMRAAQLS